MGLRGLLILIGIAVASAAAQVVVVDKPGFYDYVSGERVVINASDVRIGVLEVRGSGGEVALPREMTAYKVKPTVGCAVVIGERVVVETARVHCVNGLLIFNSTDVYIGRLEMWGDPSLPVYRRGLGFYVFGSRNVTVNAAVGGYFHDCIYAEYSSALRIGNFSLASCRYGVHIMFSDGVSVANGVVRDSYVGVAVMYTSNATVKGVEAVDNREWSEGYGFLITEVRGGAVENCRAVGNIHGFYILTWGGTAVAVSNCAIEGNYVGVTIRGKGSSGVAFYNNSLLGNVVQVVYMAIGEDFPQARFLGNMWQGHGTSAPYVYVSAFSDLFTATEGALGWLAAFPARAVIDGVAGRPLAFDPSPAPARGGSPWQLALLFVLPIVAYAVRRRA